MENITVAPTPLEQEHFCKQLLYFEIPYTPLRLWDLLILIPNACFFIFLCITCPKAVKKLRIVSSPIFTTFYFMIWTDVIASLVRCIVAMCLDAAGVPDATVEKVLWVFVRFVLLSTEVCVIVLSLAFGHLDSKKCICYVLLVTSAFSLAFSITQGFLEISSPDESFHVIRTGKEYDLFGHGGMLFWFLTSFTFCLIYSFIFVLPWTPLRNKLALPTKASFYSYIFALGALNLASSVGSGLLLANLTISGLCLVDFTTYLYFTLLTPYVYMTFLANFFATQQPFLPISYKTQLDDLIDEENMSLPHQSSMSSIKTNNSDYIFQGNSMYDSSTFVIVESGATTPVRVSTPPVGFVASKKQSPTRESTGDIVNV